jgi:hypothetical protein
MFEFLDDIPIVGDIKKGVFGDPNAVKAAYDAQIKASQQNAEQMKQFLLGQQGKAQAFYAPMQHMFRNYYGTQGIQGPQVPTATFASTYGGK